MKENLRPPHRKHDQGLAETLLSPVHSPDHTYQQPSPSSRSVNRSVSDSFLMPPPPPPSQRRISNQPTATLGSSSSERPVTSVTKRSRIRTMSPEEEGQGGAAADMVAPSSKRARTDPSFNPEFIMDDIFMDSDMTTDHDMHSQASFGESSDGGWSLRCPPPTPDHAASPSGGGDSGGDTMGSFILGQPPSDAFQSSTGSVVELPAAVSFDIYEDPRTDEQMMQLQLEETASFHSDLSSSSESNDKENIGIEVNIRPDTSLRSSRNTDNVLNPINLADLEAETAHTDTGAETERPHDAAGLDELMDIENDGDGEQEVNPSETSTIVSNIWAHVPRRRCHGHGHPHNSQPHHQDRAGDGDNCQRNHNRFSLSSSPATSSSSSAVSSFGYDASHIWESDEEFRTDMEEVLREFGAAAVGQMDDQIRNMIDRLPAQSSSTSHGVRRLRFFIYLRGLIRTIPHDISQMSLSELMERVNADMELRDQRQQDLQLFTMENSGSNSSSWSHSCEVGDVDQDNDWNMDD